jgi:prephenate dehydratase
MSQHVRIGVSGEAGSFSEEAALVYAQRAELPASLIYLLDMEGVLAAVEAGRVELGIFPVVNVNGGLVTQAFVAMGRHLFQPMDELWHPISQCLLVLPGTSPESIDMIVSHSQALAQCTQYLQKEFQQAEHLAWSDTAQAASDLSTGKLPGSCAVIASARCAEIYQLEVLARDIQDAQPNLTAFIVAKKLAQAREYQ